MTNKYQQIIQNNFSNIQNLFESVRKECKKIPRNKEQQQLINEYRRKLEFILKTVDDIELIVAQSLNIDYKSRMMESQKQKLDRIMNLIKSNKSLTKNSEN